MARKPSVTAHKTAEDVKIAPLTEANEATNQKLERVEATSTDDQPRAERVVEKFNVVYPPRAELVENVNVVYPPRAERVVKPIVRYAPTKVEVVKPIVRYDGGMKVTVTGVDDPDSGAGHETSSTKRKT